MARPTKTVRVRVTLDYDVPVRDLKAFREDIEARARDTLAVSASIEQPLDVTVKTEG